jgi:hypothetical protein
LLLHLDASANGKINTINTREGRFQAMYWERFLMDLLAFILPSPFEKTLDFNNPDCSWSV